MKCICGYEQPEDRYEEKEVLFLSGPRKGQFKCLDVEHHPVKPEDKFIKIYVEKEFSFLRSEEGSYTNWEYNVELYACPKCHTIKALI